MVPAGYMAKKVVMRPAWIKNGCIEDIYSVSNCVSDDFTDYIKYWRHNQFRLFNSVGDIEQLAREEHIDLLGTTMFYYEIFEKEFDDDESGKWLTFALQTLPPTRVEAPNQSQMAGYDVVAAYCSPLSCNSLADEISVNKHCLFDTLEQAKQALESGKFDDSEPGPFRIFAVYRVRPALPGF